MSAQIHGAHTPGAAGSSLAAEIEAAAMWLPEQAPLSTFVHHNTLHHLEDLPFEEAVVVGSKRLRTSAFQSEAAFAEHLRSGRIQRRDVEAVLDVRTDQPGRLLFSGGPSVREFRGLRLRHFFEIPSGAALRWTLLEGGGSTQIASDVDEPRRRAIHARGPEAASLAALWSALEASAPPIRETHAPSPRWRDRLRIETGIDTDEWVHPLLIRLSAAFLDQGVAYWRMPDRELGFLVAFRRLYGRRAGPPLRWARGLAEAVARQEALGLTAEETIEWALAEFGVTLDERVDYLRDTLLSLRGWAGMMQQFEHRPDRAPVEAMPARLADYLAVQLILDLFAAQACARNALGHEGPLAKLPAVSAVARAERDGALVYESFLLAQLSEVPFERFFEPAVARAWLEAVAAFDTIERRCVLHLAYERRHRVEVLDALAIHSREPAPRTEPAAFQAIFCIDDREESTRRHLEELEPAVETFGYAGFFGVAMDYQGLDDVRSRPLCPVVIQPAHRISEVSTSSPEHAKYVIRRRRRGVARRASVVGSRTLVRGGLASPLFGPLSTIALVGRVLFPRLAHRIAHFLEELGVERPLTRLAIEADPDQDIQAAIRSGYSIDEMAGVVGSALRTMGLDHSLSPLVLVVGHGSSSLNNPHEAAHDCGATGGGRGGPNARAFAAMANHPNVRAELDRRGTPIKQSTWFLGAYHNTCDDGMTYFDEDLVPIAHAAVLARAKRAFAAACIREAHERCRRFETAALTLGVDPALEEAQEHSVDLAQPRPEYGHATNAVCLVGRRQRTQGLFLDRRAFLVSYDPTTDPDGARLAPLLLAVGPVGAGINLEYYFSFVDPAGYGCGTKLPHNIVGLLGVMDGHASDLRTGLPWQMVEIHEPVRLLVVVEARKHVLEKILAEQAGLMKLVRNGWIQFVCWDPDSPELFVFEKGKAQVYTPESKSFPTAPTSIDYYRGHREHLPPARIGVGARR